MQYLFLHGSLTRRYRKKIRKIAADFSIHLLDISSYAGTYENTENAAMFGAAKVMQDKSVRREERVIEAYNISKMLTR